MTLAFSRRLAVAAGLVLPVLETLRRMFVLTVVALIGTLRVRQ
jgi:hypothetical protein